MDDNDKTLLILARGLLILNVIFLVVFAIFKPHVYCSIVKLFYLFFIFSYNILFYLDIRDCIRKEMAVPAKFWYGMPIVYINTVVFNLVALSIEGKF
jgi:hypothetical protein